MGLWYILSFCFVLVWFGFTKVWGRYWRSFFSSHVKSMISVLFIETFSFSHWILLAYLPKSIDYIFGGLFLLSLLFLMVPFDEQKFLIIIYIYILKYIHTFIVSAYYVLFMKILPTPRSWIYYHVSSKSFIVLPFTFRPTVPLGQIFVCVCYEVRIQLT